MGKKLLVIDQNLAVQRLLEFTLSKEGFEISAVEDAIAGLDSAYQAPPDLIMVDAQLDGLPLNMFIQKVRERENLQSTPIVLMAQSSESLNMEQLRRSGITEVLKKPLDAIEINATIARCLPSAEPVAVRESSASQPSSSSTEEDQEMIQIEQLLGWVPQDKGAQAPPEPAPSVAETEKPQAEASAPAKAVVQQKEEKTEEEVEAPQAPVIQPPVVQPIELSAGDDVSLEDMLMTGAEAIHYQPPPQAPPPPPPVEPEPAAEPSLPSELDELLSSKKPIPVKSPGKSAPPVDSPSPPMPSPQPESPAMPSLVNLSQAQTEAMIRTMVEELTRTLAKETIERVTKEIVPEIAEREVRAEIERLKNEP